MSRNWIADLAGEENKWPCRANTCKLGDIHQRFAKNLASPLLSVPPRRRFRVSSYPAAEETGFMSFHLLSVRARCVIKFPAFLPVFPCLRHRALITSDPCAPHRQNLLSSKLRLEIRQKLELFSSCRGLPCITLHVGNASRSMDKVESPRALAGASRVSCISLHVSASARRKFCGMRTLHGLIRVWSNRRGLHGLLHTGLYLRSTSTLDRLSRTHRPAPTKNDLNNQPLRLSFR
jgi:hypothetical protein